LPLSRAWALVGGSCVLPAALFCLVSGYFSWRAHRSGYFASVSRLVRCVALGRVGLSLQTPRGWVPRRYFLVMVGEFPESRGVLCPASAVSRSRVPFPVWVFAR